MTEETEFSEIYRLDVIEIPTNKPIQRVDLPDVIFRTEKGKYDCLIRDIEEANKNGQPVLVGTISIDKSEELSKLLKKKGIKHNVLNAKFHEKEAEIVAQAGKLGAVTIATNMAGRGTDIKLGGNEEFLAKDAMRKLNYSEELINEATGYAETDDQDILDAREKYRELLTQFKAEIDVEAEKVREAGGLFIMGTTRHESRRIDNQLRGRSGRQGDPGASRFYLSAEDDILRLFAGDRIKSIMDRMPGEDDEPLESKLLSNVIESAQSKVEGRNFSIRKSVLEYDDVMNRQREIIYSQRDQVLDGENLRDTIIKMVGESMESIVNEYLPHEDKDHWNLEGLKEALKGWILEEDDKETLVYTDDELEKLEKEYLINELTEIATKRYEENETKLPEETMRELERVYLLKNVDNYWMDHIDAMDELKRGIRLRSYGQHDPVVEYRIEGFDMFDDMIRAIREDTVKMMMVVPRKVAQRLEEQERMRQMMQQRVATGRARAAAIAALKNNPEVDPKILENESEIQVIEIGAAPELQRQDPVEAVEEAAEAAEAAEAEKTEETAAEKEEPSDEDIRKAAGKFMEREQVAKPTSTNMDSTSSSINKTVRGVKKIGRNDPCPCGSGKKYKKCCGRNQ